jgi:hypothetical protein
MVRVTEVTAAAAGVAVPTFLMVAKVGSLNGRGLATINGATVL